MSSNDVFAYFLDEELVRSALPAWPGEMNLILCLKADGSCSSVVCHREEGLRALRKAAAVLGRPERSFAVAPEVEGWPTWRVRFSEEQDLLKLIAGTRHLVELANDYLINFQFAKDEGLNPEAVVGRRTVQPPQPQPSLARSPKDVAWKLKSASARSRLHLSLPARDKPLETPKMPAGFAPCQAKRECRFGTGFIGGSGSNVRVVLAPEKLTIHVRPVRVTEIGFSSDFWRYYLPRRVLDGWTPGQPAVIDIPADAFPEALSGSFRGRRFHVSATITPEGVFLAPGAAVEPGHDHGQDSEDDTDMDEDTSPALASRKRWRTPLRAATLALLVAGTAAGAGILPFVQRGGQGPAVAVESPASP